jgi:N-acetylglucosaminyldiphosphoundecaprenol N-acetyl-beta-D-mannosaminyltransferase
MDSSHRYPWKTVELLGVRIAVVSVEQLLAEIQACITERRKVAISYVNVHAINTAYLMPWFRDFLNNSHLTFCDGVGVKLAAIITGQRLQYRFTPPDFMDLICELASRNNWKVFFLGARPGVSQVAANKLLAKLPGFQIETHHGYFDKTREGSENQQVVQKINQFQPQILVLGFGMPIQEKWIMENIASLDVNIAFPAGALFDYLSGGLPRGPRWMTDNGLEWLGRFVVEPRRLWRRYILGNPLFFWRLFIHRVLGISLPQ